MTVSIIKRASTVGTWNSSDNYFHVTPDTTWDGTDNWFDLTGGALKFDLPPASSLPAGWQMTGIIDSPSSNPLQFMTTQDGDSLNHFWRTKLPSGEAMPYGLFVNMTQRAFSLTCDGVSEYKLRGLSHHMEAYQSQRTITQASWGLTPLSQRENVRCTNTPQGSWGGGWITIQIDPLRYWCPPSPVTGGNYHSFNVRIEKVDSAPQGVVIETIDGSHITPNNDSIVNPGYNRGYLYLQNQGDVADLYIGSDAVRVDHFSRASWPPLQFT